MKKILLLLLFIAPFVSTKAQSYTNGFVVNLGVVQDGFGGLFNYNYFVDRHDFIEASILFTASKYKYDSDIEIPYNDFTFNLGFSKNVFYNYQNTFNININAGGVFGYETVNRGENNLDNGSLILSKPGFVYGAFIGIDVDLFLTDQLSLVLKTNEYYHANSTLGEFLPYIGLGLRFYTN